MRQRLPYVWDYDIDEGAFLEILRGRKTLGHLDQKWAVLRLMEHAPYSEIVRLAGFKEIVRWWPVLRSQIRSAGRKRGFDFLVDWLPRNHPELLHE